MALTPMMPASTAPAAPSRWPVMDLVELTASLLGVLAEDLLDGHGLEPVADGRGGAVGVDVVDLLRLRCPASLRRCCMTRARRRRRLRKAR